MKALLVQSFSSVLTPYPILPPSTHHTLSSPGCTHPAAVRAGSSTSGSRADGGSRDSSTVAGGGCRDSSSAPYGWWQQATEQGHGGTRQRREASRRGQRHGVDEPRQLGASRLRQRGHCNDDGRRGNDNGCWWRTVDEGMRLDLSFVRGSNQWRVYKFMIH